MEISLSSINLLDTKFFDVSLNCHLLFFRKSRYERKPAECITVYFEFVTSLFFFQEGTVTNSTIWLVLHGSPDFPISAHGHGNAHVSFWPFVYKAISAQKVFAKQLFMRGTLGFAVLVNFLCGISIILILNFVIAVFSESAGWGISGVLVNDIWLKRNCFTRFPTLFWFDWFLIVWETMETS